VAGVKPLSLLREEETVVISSSGFLTELATNFLAHFLHSGTSVELLYRKKRRD